MDDVIATEVLDDASATSASNRQADLVIRLRRIEGQIRGIVRMIENDRTCEDLVTQIMAVRSGMDRVASEIVRLHIDRCLADLPTEAVREEMGRIVELMQRIS